MVMNKNRKAAKRKPLPPRVRMIDGLMRKLEANPHKRYEDVLTVREYSEAVLMMREAIAYAQGCLAALRYNGKQLRKPSRFTWCGRTYRLHYSNCGRLFIVSPGGKRVLGSGYFVI